MIYTSHKFDAKTPQLKEGKETGQGWESQEQ
jgi:hypothetical protein